MCYVCRYALMVFCQKLKHRHAVNKYITGSRSHLNWPRTLICLKAQSIIGPLTHWHYSPRSNPCIATAPHNLKQNSKSEWRSQWDEDNLITNDLREGLWTVTHTHTPIYVYMRVCVCNCFIGDHVLYTLMAQTVKSSYCIVYHYFTSLSTFDYIWVPNYWNHWFWNMFLMTAGIHPNIFKEIHTHTL